MQRHHIPTAASATFTDAQEAHAYIDHLQAPCVIKADGLAAGKGVVVASNAKEAHAAVDDMLVQKKHGHASATIIVEERLYGTEMSFMILATGEQYVPLATSRDYKRLLDGDHGPNTGGMGAYSPHELLTDSLLEDIVHNIVEPTLKGAMEDGMPYEGFLYVGLMIDEAGRPFVLEYNCRLGDPETCPLLLRLQDDLFTVLWEMTEKRLPKILNWDSRHAVGVVLAAEGYPDAPKLGEALLHLPQESDDVTFFHAGTILKDNRFYIAGAALAVLPRWGRAAPSLNKRHTRPSCLIPALYSAKT